MKKVDNTTSYLGDQLIGEYLTSCRPRALALPAAVDTEALKEATASFGVTLIYDIFENFFGTDLVAPRSQGTLLWFVYSFCCAQTVLAGLRENETRTL